MTDVRIYPELVKNSPNAPVAQNLTPESTSLEEARHPHPTPPDHHVQSLRIFIEAMENLYEKDYGDFMREANAYILDLKDALARTTPDALQKLQEMQEYTQFNPNWSIEITRQWLIRDAQALLNHVARGQPEPSDNPSQSELFH